MLRRPSEDGEHFDSPFFGELLEPEVEVERPRRSAAPSPADESPFQHAFEGYEPPSREGGDPFVAHEELEVDDAEDFSDTQDDVEDFSDTQDDVEDFSDTQAADNSELADAEQDEPEQDSEELEAFDADEALDHDGEIDAEHLGLFERQVPDPAATATLGFEFDLNFGFEEEVAQAKSLSPPTGWSWPAEGLRVTDHEWKTSAGDWKDAIQVTLDAVRMEISTAPFHIGDDSEFERVVKAVLEFGKELKLAKKKRETRVTVPTFRGHPTTFTHPRTVVNKPSVDAHGVQTHPGDSEHASYQAASVPLVVHRVSRQYPTDTALWASPQATITLPLDKFGALVWEINKTRGGDPGVAFTGRRSQRLGLRDDLAWQALKSVFADRKQKLGAELSDGSKVTDADYTRSITALATILVMYMLTSVLRDERDGEREFYAKGSLPLNVKTPLWQIHKFALTDRERFVFKELYGAPDKRVNLYALAKPGADTSDGATKLFPDYTHGDVERFFTSLPTWELLVQTTVDEQPIKVTKDNIIPKKKHKKGDEILIAPLSNKIVWDKTKPRIAVEMRRLGFAPVHFSQWRGLMKRLRTLAMQVNP